MKGIFLLVLIATSSLSFAQGQAQSRQTLVLQLKPTAAMQVDRSFPGTSVQFDSNTGVMLNVNSDKNPFAGSLTVQTSGGKPPGLDAKPSKNFPLEVNQTSVALNLLSIGISNSNRLVYTLTNR